MITKKLYIDCVNSISNWLDFEDKLYSMTNGSLYLSNFEYLQELVNKFEELLEYCTKDKVTREYGSNLSYFLCELDSGKKYVDGCITDSEGNNISCKSPEELWDNFIIDSHPEVEDNQEGL